MMGGGSPSSGHARMTATSGERRRRAGGDPGPDLRRGEGAGVEEGAAGGAGAEASEEIEEGVTEAEVETRGRLISLHLQREEEVPSGDQTGATSPEADLLTDEDTDDIKMLM